MHIVHLADKNLYPEPELKRNAAVLGFFFEGADDDDVEVDLLDNIDFSKL
jgi:hypothetical protein